MFRQVRLLLMFITIAFLPIMKFPEQKRKTEKPQD